MEPELYQLPTLDSQDLRQDQALAELEGRSKSKIRRPYASQRAREYGYGAWPSEDVEPLFQPLRPDPETVEALIVWVTAQERNVALAVMEYLDDPGDERLSKVQELVGVEHHGHEVTKTRGVTFSALLLRSLPATQEDLYELARREHLSRRPEAAVRQTLRNLARRNVIIKDEYGVWSHA